MLYIVGLGMNEKGISLEGLEACKDCDVIYLEDYTVNFPYNLDALKEIIGKNIIPLDRENVENLEFVNDAKEKNICLLVYGSPIVATTHNAILLDCKSKDIQTKVIQASNIFNEIGNCGLNLYKFGRVASMPTWSEDEKYRPTSFMEIVAGNQEILAHSLILADIDLEFKDAIKQLKTSAEKEKVKIDKIIICSRLGTDEEKIYYKPVSELNGEEVKLPFCIIIPSELHFMEEEFLKTLDKI